jgi:hypothetical protein
VDGLNILEWRAGVGGKRDAPGAARGGENSQYPNAKSQLPEPPAETLRFACSAPAAVTWGLGSGLWDVETDHIYRESFRRAS